MELLFNLMMERSSDGETWRPHGGWERQTRAQVERKLRGHGVPGRAVTRMLSGSGGRWPTRPDADTGVRYGLRVELVEPEVRAGPRRVQGGHAVMLRIPPGTGTWLSVPALRANHTLSSSWWKDPENLHLTLQFVGRDLEREQVGWMLRSALQLEPQPLHFTGRYDVLRTGKGAHLVALVDSEPLLGARDRLRNLLKRDPKIVLRDQFKFNPHVTLLEAPPGTELVIPEPLEPGTITATELEVKYGSRRMVVDLA